MTWLKGAEAKSRRFTLTLAPEPVRINDSQGASGGISMFGNHAIWPYVVALVLVGAILLARHLLSEPKKETFFKSATTILMIVIALWAAIDAGVGRWKEAKDNRPDLTGWVTKVSFLPSPTGMTQGAQGRPKGAPGITFELCVSNHGRVPTTITNVWLVPEGSTRDDAHSLCLTPQRPRIEGLHEMTILAKDFDPDAQRLRGSNATLLLRDASEREYAVEVCKISHGSRGKRIRDIPVRED